MRSRAICADCKCPGWTGEDLKWDKKRETWAHGNCQSKPLSLDELAASTFGKKYRTLSPSLKAAVRTVAGRRALGDTSKMDFGTPEEKRVADQKIINERWNNPKGVRGQ